MKGSFDLTVQPMQAWKTDAKTSMMMIIVLKRTIIYNFNNRKKKKKIAGQHFNIKVKF